VGAIRNNRRRRGSVKLRIPSDRGFVTGVTLQHRVGIAALA
jgi:hypothetical protein